MSGQGRLIGVVGASGTGKDTIIAGLIARRPELTRVVRTITRPPDGPGETSVSVTPEQFARMRAQGAFALSWGAHDLLYGIEWRALAPLGDGHTMLVNLSRGVLRDARAKFPGFRALNIATSPHVLRRRLEERGRESADEIARRLARPAPALPEDVDVVTILNDTTIAAAVQSALDGLGPVRA